MRTRLHRYLNISMRGRVAQQNRLYSSTPLALDSLAPFLFPSLHADLITAPLKEAWNTFQVNYSFYLASLNFLYLMLSAKHLHSALSIADLWSNNDVAGSFLQPLREASTRFKEEMAEEAVGYGGSERRKPRRN